MTALHTARILGLLTTLWLLAPAMARSQQADQASTSVPAGTIAYVSVDLPRVIGFWEQAKNSTLVKTITSMVRKGDQAGGNQPDPAAAAQNLLAIVAQLLNGPAVVALADEKVTPGEAPSILVSMPIKNAEQVRGVLALIEAQLRQRKAELATHDYGGVTVTTVTTGDPKIGRPSYALLPDRLMVASRPEWLEKALDAAAGRAPRLVDEPRFEQVRALLAAKPAGTAWFWVDSGRIQRRALEAAQEAQKAAANTQGAGGPKPPVNFDALKMAMEVYGVTGGRLDLSPNGIVLDGFQMVNRENELGRRLLAMKGAPLRSASLVSGNAVFYASLSNLPALVEMMSATLNAMGVNVQQMLGGVTQSLEGATGLDLKKDVLDYVGAEAALVINDLPAKIEISSIPALLYVQTTNTPGLGKTMQKLRAHLAKAMGMEFVQKDLPQGRLYITSPDASTPLPVALGWTFAGGFLVVGTTPEALKSPLFLAKGTGTSLAAVPSFQRAAAAIGNEPTAALFINLARLSKIADSPILPKKEGAPQVDPAKVKQVLQALGSLSMFTAVQQDAIAFRTELAVDLTK